MMHMLDVWKVLRRRWYLILLTFALCAGVVVGLASRLEPTYRATASIVLVPPDSTVGEAGNPYLYLGGLAQSVDVLSRSVNAEATRKRIEVTAPTGEYVTVADVTTSAPIIVVTAEDASAAGSERLLAAVLAEVPTTLLDLQARLDVRPASQITSQVVTLSEEPEVVQKERYRSIALGGIFVLVLGLLLTGLLDGLLVRRRRKRDDDD